MVRVGRYAVNDPDAVVLARGGILRRDQFRPVHFLPALGAVELELAIAHLHRVALREKALVLDIFLGVVLQFALQVAGGGPFFAAGQRDQHGEVLPGHDPEIEHLLDPRRAFLRDPIVEEKSHAVHGNGVAHGETARVIFAGRERRVAIVFPVPLQAEGVVPDLKLLHIRLALQHADELPVRIVKAEADRAFEGRRDKADGDRRALERGRRRRGRGAGCRRLLSCANRGACTKQKQARSPGR